MKSVTRATKPWPRYAKNTNAKQELATSRRFWVKEAPVIQKQKSQEVLHLSYHAPKKGTASATRQIIPWPRYTANAIDTIKQNSNGVPTIFRVSSVKEPSQSEMPRSKRCYLCRSPPSPCPYVGVLLVLRDDRRRSFSGRDFYRGGFLVEFSLAAKVPSEDR